MSMGSSKSDDWDPSVLDAKEGIALTSPIKVDPLLGIGAVVSFARNREIFAQDEPATCLYKVISGAVRTCRHFSDGRRQVGAFYLAGEMFGLELDARHVFSAEAITSSKVLVLKRSTVTLWLNGRTASHLSYGRSRHVSYELRRITCSSS